MDNVPNDTLRLYAIWESIDLQIGNTNYNVDDNVLTGIDIGTDIGSIDLMLPSGYSYSVYDGDSIKTQGSVGTGNIIKIYQNGQYVTEYTVSIKGDVTGDGVLEINDLLMVRGYILGSKHYSNRAYEFAADYCNDTGVEINDFLKMRKDFLSN